MDADTTIYKAGIYLRLSQEDESAGESESITNQKEFVSRYVLSQGWHIAGVYTDDGWSGTNFNRPAFQQLLADMESRKINLVITKDLSRLGRDYIETGYYLERYFPLNNIRYIAITDSIDTFDYSSNSDMIPFKAVINDMYAKDISKKIRATIDSKRHNGQFIGAFAPFGYMKARTNKNKLVIDETAAAIVRRIYDMYLNGVSMSHITQILNEENILSPTEYKKRNSAYVNANAKYGIWRQQTIKDILSNPTYIGHMAQGKNKKINYKTLKFKKIKKADWIIAENTHEPIINEDTFQIVQSMLSRYASIDYGSHRAEHLLAGFLVCGDCGMPVSFRRGGPNKKFHTLCSNNARFQKCLRHAIYEDELNELVINDLKRISCHAIPSTTLIKKLESNFPKVPANPLERNITSIDKRLSTIQAIIKNLYEDKTCGVLSEDDFLSMMESFHLERESLLNRRSSTLYNMKTDTSPPIDPATLIQSLITFERPNKTLLAQLIDKVELFEIKNGQRFHDKQIKIHYSFPNPYLNKA